MVVVVPPVVLVVELVAGAGAPGVKLVDVEVIVDEVEVMVEDVEVIVDEVAVKSSASSVAIGTVGH